MQTKNTQLQEQLKATKRQRIRDIRRHPDQEELLEETYDELESELQKKIENLHHQIELWANKHNTILRVNRAAKTALDVFQDILEKEHFDRNDLELIIQKIKVYEDHLEIQLQSDIDVLLRSDVMEEAVNFKSGIEDISLTRIVQKATHQKDKASMSMLSVRATPGKAHCRKQTTWTPVVAFSVNLIFSGGIAGRRLF